MKLISLIATLVFSISAFAADVREKTEVIVVHHSATQSGNVETFRDHHVRVNKWDDIGYHFVITNGRGGRNGEVQRGRPLEKVGSHAKGRNHNSLGVCLVGNDSFTDAQIDVLVKFLTEACRKYGIVPSEKTIERHHDKCPGGNLNLSEVIEKVKRLL